MFERDSSPLKGQAETVGGLVLRSRRAVPEPVVEPTSADPLAAALLSWAEPPKPPKKPERTIERLDAPELESWRRLLEEEERARRWLLEQERGGEDDDWRRWQKRRRRR
jgi:hypothetical protein